MTTDAERQLSGFIEKFEPELQALLRAARKVLRKRFPTAFELVYDNYNFFVIGYAPTERPSDAIVSLVGGANGVSLCLIQGAKLPDPDKVMSGGGSQTRFIRLASAKVLSEPAVAAVVDAAEAHSKTPFSTTGHGELIIRSVSAKQRPRRKTS